MYINFAPSSNGTYNNSGSIRQLANYLEHEDLERMEKGIYTEGFFNLAEDNIYKSKVIKDIDSNIGQLLKTDAKFYAIHVSPSEKELRVMGNTEQEQVEAMKRYVREIFIPEYAKNFNKELSSSDIKFYGKIHFDRSRSDNELNMHCHLIVSRKDQNNKKKLSPLTNHKNTKNGVIKGGFERVNLFQRIEQGFDKLFNNNRQQTKSFNYHNTMKNGSIPEKLKSQEEVFQSSERKTEINQENILSINPENQTTSNQTFSTNVTIGNKQGSNTFVNPHLKPQNNETSGSFISAISTESLFSSNQLNPESQPTNVKKKKKIRHKI